MSVDLPSELVSALDSAAATTRLLVTSDFDGTLAPIVNNPADARPLPAAAQALVALADLAATTTALISGRALETLRELSSMPATVHLIGSHGAEFDSGFAHDIDHDLLRAITDRLRAIASDKPGVAVETKPASVALHVRNASPADGEAALAAAWEAAPEWEAHVTTGKAVLEFAVIDTDKGAAVDILRGECDATAVVFFGDDVTDEKAFARLRRSDVGVKVGPGESAAGYRIDSPDAVAAALEHLVASRKRLA
ncbi:MULTISPECIES: trehalose-phosphatase [Mycolicibacterium]|uniref:Trehalose 6-phosphate phosphatase n=2 Tax=Mycolicibacterium TaxID=1866885 RepID=A1TFY4_MYCVP|nr:MULTISPECIES: trehalose-phosphatase [Mycolicibacterium]ABM16084.1 trehalose 6-phosphatase [Mycolicibacterium vanbaalenii PYR-1]MCV7129624.1 trehalose-phosphatase [Mycolicibacterium vanbaalenii PYR-1]MDN4517346.1 trehalose-phosphatase [Mycolicibacterium austroafricanum]MDW5611632.1 trehalose-phosphatase [Mycolicibacterium sp. D5.8-2]PQP42837.1 trehalose-phosphatase [Mycolicibacterium austroafricanum]